MFRIVIGVLFAFVLVADFVIEVSRKDIKPADVLIRGFMVVAWGYLAQSMQAI